MRTRANNWGNPQTGEIFYGIDAWHDGQWKPVAEDGKPLFFETKAEREARRAAMRKEPAPPATKHLHGEAWTTECGLRSMKVQVAHNEDRATCDECKRIRRERHEQRIATDSAYRKNHEQVAAFAALGIKVGKYGPISMTASEADKVLRKLRKAVRP